MSDETAKMCMGPSNTTDVNLSKNPIDANNVFKKDSIDTEMENESRPDEKLGLDNSSYDVRERIANYADLDLLAFDRQLHSIHLSNEALDNSIQRKLYAPRKVNKIIDGEYVQVMFTYEPHTTI